jgi:hypothetical protein
LQSGVVPLKPPDVGFYMKIMQAALDRYQHPTAKDLADIAEAKRLRQLQLIGQAKMTEDFKAGNMQKGAEDMFHPTPEQSATMDRAAALTGGVPEMLAMDAGMPSGQWDELQRRVEYAAGIDNRSGYGSGDSGQAPALTPEQKARVSALLRTEAANKDLVAPSAGEIKRLSALVMQSGADSIQRNRDTRP